MQTANVQELKELLLKTDEEFRQLATQHHELDDRLHQLSGSLTSANLSKSKKSLSRNASSNSKTGWKIFCAATVASRLGHLRRRPPSRTN